MQCVLLAVIVGLYPGLQSPEKPAPGRTGGCCLQGRFSYMVSLRVPPGGDHFCGGSLIRDNVVLTAAHW